MRKHLTISIVTIGCALLLWGARTTAQQSPDFSFSTIDFHGAIQTIAYGINPGGDIVGAYRDSSGQHGFLLSGGNFNPIDAQIDGVTYAETSARGINPAGEIVGTYTVGSGPARIKGFLLSHGTFSTVLFGEHPGAIPQRITPDGDIYGCYHDNDDGINILASTMHGFVRTRRSSIGLDVPASMNNGATPNGHTIVGLWTDSTGHRHGFLVQNGIFQSYDVPGSVLTAIWDINPGQEFVGTYFDSGANRHGFLQLPDGSAPVTIDYPGAAGTLPYGVNAGGVIVGSYSASGKTHGFFAVPRKSD